MPARLMNPDAVGEAVEDFFQRGVIFGCLCFGHKY